VLEQGVGVEKGRKSKKSKIEKAIKLYNTKDHGIKDIVEIDRCKQSNIILIRKEAGLIPAFF
jgi:hypothetical protein